jgi:hypothetical protein
MLILAALFLAGIIAELFAVRLAPFGYQDETGFHLGIRRAGKDSRRSSTGKS